MAKTLNSRTEELTIFADGGARGNPGPAACACVVKDDAGKERVLRGKYLGKATNNLAEYEAVILAYEEILNLRMPNSRVRLKFNLDSNLVVSQLNGTFKVKDGNLRLLVAKIRELEGTFFEVYYKHIPREKNKVADKIVNETLNRH